MTRFAQRYSVLGFAAALAVSAVLPGYSYAAENSSANYQVMQQHLRRVQRQLSKLSNTVGNLRKEQAEVRQQQLLIRQQQKALARQEYLIKKQQAGLTAQQAKLKAAQVKANSTSQRATDEAIKHLYNQVMANSRNIAGTQGAAGTNNINATMENLFAPPTADRYFSPFKDENPDHMRPDMNMQVGQWGNMKFYMGFWTVGRFQALQEFSTGTPVGLNPNFQTPYADLSLYAKIPHEFDMFADFYIATPGHPSNTYGNEGWLVFKQIPGVSHNSLVNKIMDYVNVKVGAFTIDFGDNNYHRSNNAWVQNNPLIGNPLVDPSTEEIGGEVYSVKGPVYWLVGLSNGGTTGHYDYGAGPGIHGKIWGYPVKHVRLSASVYYADMGDSKDTSYLYAATRSGEPYNNLFGPTDDDGQIAPQAGRHVFAAQGDITYENWPFESYSYVGWTRDGQANLTGVGTPTESWLYGSSNLVYHINPALYLAAQYSYAFAGSVSGVDSNGWVGRLQVGAGYWLTKSMLAKLEYVQEQFYSFRTNTNTVDGANASQGPGFNGVVMEVSFGF